MNFATGVDETPRDHVLLFSKLQRGGGKSIKTGRRGLKLIIYPA
jgi:hypothetical protein